MFLLHRRLRGVDGFADAAQLEKKKKRRRGQELILDLGRFASPPTHTTIRPHNGRNEKYINK